MSFLPERVWTDANGSHYFFLLRDAKNRLVGLGIAPGTDEQPLECHFEDHEEFIVNLLPALRAKGAIELKAQDFRVEMRDDGTIGIVGKE